MKPAKNTRSLSERAAAKTARILDSQIRSKWKEFWENGMELGRLLSEYRDRGYWKQQFTSFREYCESIGISKTHVYRLIGCSEIVEALPDDAKKKIRHLNQAEALLGVPRNDRPEVISRAEKQGEVTPTVILQENHKLQSERNVRESHNGTVEFQQARNKIDVKTKKVHFDKIGTPLTDEALPWGQKDCERVKEVQYILRELSRLKSIVLEGRQKGEYHWMKLTNTIENDFSYLYFLISEAKPYAICTTCMGSPSLKEEGCSYCHNTGLISKRCWDTMSMKEVKDMRMRSNYDLAKKYPDSPLNNKDQSNNEED